MDQNLELLYVITYAEIYFSSLIPNEHYLIHLECVRVTAQMDQRDNFNGSKSDSLFVISFSEICFSSLNPRLIEFHRLKEYKRMIVLLTEQKP